VGWTEHLDGSLSIHKGKPVPETGSFRRKWELRAGNGKHGGVEGSMMRGVGTCGPVGCARSAPEGKTSEQ